MTPIRHLSRAATGLVVAAAAIFGTTACAGRPKAAYHPRQRTVTVTTVPLLVKETAKVYPFLAGDFAPGGVLAGKEVYAFSPSTITVVAGDTVAFTFINPEDDVHDFVMPGLTVNLPAQDTVHATYVAREPGILPFECSIPSHLPMMAGELVVLSPEAVEQ